MPLVAQYLLKLSIGIGVVCLLYQLLFRHLTFYTWNRYFLLIYSMLAFIVPLIDITPALEKLSYSDNILIQAIPVLQNISSTESELPRELSSASAAWSSWSIVLWVVGIGIGVMLVRFLTQLWALKKLVKDAQLVDSSLFKIYQIDKNIPPFSFGDAVFINRNLHDASDLESIIRHELIHVKQQHTIDILWAELLCVVNWYNPLAWWIKKDIKQNLEYIADNKVVEGGTSKKDYQHLLLKVIGGGYLPVASPFNFSSLKKRIFMMNRVKSAKTHLLKFLFVVPFLAVILLSFRGKERKSSSEPAYTIMGILFDEVTLQPISNGIVKDSATGINFTTDDKGFYKIIIPRIVGNELMIRFQIIEKDYPTVTSGKILVGKNDPNKSLVILLGMTSTKDLAIGAGKGSGMYSYGVDQSRAKSMTDYDYVSEEMDKLKKHKLLLPVTDTDPRPIRIIDGIPSAVGNGSRATFDKSEVEESPTFKVWADGKIISMEEANREFNRFDLKGVGASPKASSKELFGLNCNVLIIFKDSLPPTNSPR